MTTAATSLLGLALPVQGELSGTWGDTVNNSITSLLDTAIAGTTTLSTDADVTLTTTQLAANQARAAIILWTAGGTVTRTITVPAQSKPYIVVNKTSSTQSIVLIGATGAGVTLIAGEKAVVAFNGTDFVKISNLNGISTFTNVTPGFTSTATAAATTTLTSSSTYFQRFTGTTTQTVVLPAGTAMAKGQGFIINNESTGNVTLQNGTPTTLGTIVSGMSLYVYCEDNSTTAGAWATYLFVPGVGVSSAQVTWGTAGLSMGGQTITNAIWNGTPVGASYGGTGVTTGVYGFKNRIINGAFNVRQYSGISASGTGNIGAYVVDRWIGTAGGSTPSFTSAVASTTLPTSSVPQYALTITMGGSSGGGLGVAQRIESIHLSDLYNQTVTVQVYLATSAAASVSWNAYYANTADTWQSVSSSSGIANLATSITSGTLSTTSSLALYTFSFNIGTNAPTNGLQIWFTTTAAASGTLTVTGLQLEKGSTATSFDYRSYQDELLLCNRYYGNYGGVLNTTALYLTVATSRTAMRVNPTVVGLAFPAGSGGALTFSAYPSTTAFTGFGTVYQSSSHSANTQCAFALNAEL
jgi:hypothetical protein